MNDCVLRNARQFQAHLERRYQRQTLQRPIPPDRLVAVRTHARLARLRGARIGADYRQPGWGPLTPEPKVVQCILL